MMNDLPRLSDISRIHQPSYDFINLSLGDDYNELYECEESIPPTSAPFTQQSPPIPSNRVPSFSVPCSASASLFDQL